MATLTLGTAATTTLTAMQFQYTASAADMATLEALIKDDKTPGSGLSPTWGARTGAIPAGTGQLFIPHRGILKLLPGDYVAVDTQTGWPILISAAAAAAAGYVHT